MDTDNNSPPISSRSSSAASSSSSSSSSSRSSSSTSSIAALLHPDNVSPTTSLSALPPVNHDDNTRRSVDALSNDTDNNDNAISVDPPSTSQQPNTTTTTTSTAPAASTSTKTTSKAPRSKAHNDPNAPASSKHHKHRTPSPSPPPPPPPAPLQTVRLKITLGGPSNYAVDVRAMSRDTGQRPPTPEVPVQPTVVSDSESEAEKTAAEGKDGKEGKKKRKKKDRNEGYYDTSDPFIDDSELALDERTFFAQTKQQGFYVSSGEVALMKDPNATPRKPKSRREKDKEKDKVEGKNYLGGLGLSVGKGLGISVRKGAKTPAANKKDAAKGEKDTETLITRVETSISAPPGMGQSYSNGDVPRQGSGPPQVQAIKSEPMDVDQEHVRGQENGTSISTASAMNGSGYEDAKTGEKRKRYTTVVEGGKRKKVVELSSFHPKLQEEVERLKQAITAESWENKGKFPPNLKPPLASLALLAIQLDEYDDHFFNLMPQLFPYNKFTMSKLIKRTIFAEHTALLHQRQDALLLELKKQADEGFANAQEEWERSVVAWDKRQAKQKEENPNGTSVNDDDSNAPPTRHPTEEMDVDHPILSAAGNGGDTPGAGKDKDSQPPAKKYRLTESMKGIIWQLVLLSNECCRLENEKNQLEGSLTVISEQGSRKNLYQKIIACYPDGWLSSGQISRDVSAMKKKFEKEAMENEV